MKKIFFLLFTLNVSLFAGVDPGDLDTSFATNGIAQITVGTVNEIFDFVVQPDRKIVTAGVTNAGGGSFNVILMRFNEDGTLDKSFAENGIRITDFGGFDLSVGIARQHDGKVIVVGQTFSGVNPPNLILARYDQERDLDPSFGPNGDGKVFLDLGGSELGFAVVIQADGKIVLGGFTVDGDADFIAIRYNPNGILDNTFNPTGAGSGIPGVVITDLGFGGEDFGRDVALQKDGKIIVAGEVTVGINPTNLGVVRYNTDGSLDDSFGANGKVIVPIEQGTTSFEGNTEKIALQADGKIIISARTGNGATPENFAIVRLNTDGTLDSSFGNNGIVISDFKEDELSRGVTLQIDGKILVAGFGFTSPGNLDYIAARYNVDGTIDTSFGNNGNVFIELGASDDFVRDISLQADGKILISGFSGTGVNPRDGILLRLLSGVRVSKIAQGIFGKYGLATDKNKQSNIL